MPVGFTMYNGGMIEGREEENGIVDVGNGSGEIGT